MIIKKVGEVLLVRLKLFKVIAAITYPKNDSDRS